MASGRASNTHTMMAEIMSARDFFPAGLSPSGVGSRKITQ